jgi:hypothetical protein
VNALKPTRRNRGRIILRTNTGVSFPAFISSGLLRPGPDTSLLLVKKLGKLFHC